MVNRDNRVQGRDIARHPFAAEQKVSVFIKGTTVLAAQAGVAGVVVTPEGEMTFQPGDYIVTDNPPTHAWPVRQQVFESTYTIERTFDFDEDPRGELRRGPEVPPMSLPPQYPGSTVHSAEKLRQETELAGREAIPAVPESDEVRLGRAERLRVLAADIARLNAEARELMDEETPEAEPEPDIPVEAGAEANPNLPTEGETAVAGEQQIDDSIEAKTTPEVTQKTPAPSDAKPKPPKDRKKAGTADSSSLEALG